MKATGIVRRIEDLGGVVTYHLWSSLGYFE